MVLIASEEKETRIKWTKKGVVTYSHIQGRKKFKHIQWKIEYGQIAYIEYA